MVTNAIQKLQDLYNQGTVPKRVVNDSRDVMPGDLFLAYPGDWNDGRHYIAEAIDRGAMAIFWEASGFDWQPQWTVPNYPIAHLKNQASQLAATVYDHPSGKMKIIGVTGTNGKTSITQWIAQAVTLLGGQAGVIGTLGTGKPGNLKPSALTTPDAVRLQRDLAELVKEGVETVAMEVSSIGIEEGRVADIDFHIAVLTNLSRDHLDYHQTMEAYQAAKEKLFTWPTVKKAIVNLSDPFGRRLADQVMPLGIEVLGYTIHPDHNMDRPHASLWLESAVDTANGQRVILAFKENRAEVELPLIGRFNTANILAVMGALLALGYRWEAIVSVLPHLAPPPGRMAKVSVEPEETLPLTIVDYAHTPDALEQALMALRPVASCRQGKLWVVFGCGGGRDKGKRPQMGEIAARLADRVVITDDNPRFDSSEAIRTEILAGMPADYLPVNLGDREKAIRFAIHHAKAEDVILIAGKGHENYQEIEGVRKHFSDAEVARQLLEEQVGP